MKGEEEMLPLVGLPLICGEWLGDVHLLKPLLPGDTLAIFVLGIIQLYF